MQRPSASVGHDKGAKTAASHSYADLEAQLREIRQIYKGYSAKARKWSIDGLGIHVEKSLWYNSQESYLNLYAAQHL